MRDLEVDRAICDKATPGPWKSVRAAYEDCLVLNDEYSLSKHDIKFITTSREGWPHAIERAIKAEAENAKLRAALSKVEDMCVSFHEGGPYQDNEEVRRIMEIYDIAHSALEGGGADG